MRLLRRAIIQAVSGGEVFPISDFFDIQKYTGNGSSSRVLVTGMDFAGVGGMVWMKNLGNDFVSNVLFDTDRGVQAIIESNASLAQATLSNTLIGFNNDGIDLGNNTRVNTTSANYTAWQWLKEQGFFDMIRYLGDNVSGRSIPHAIDHEVGMVMIKSTNIIGSWEIQHRSLGATKTLELNSDSAAATESVFDDTLAGNNSFNVSDALTVNSSTSFYAAYLFAHNPSKGIFCGDYNGDGTTSNLIVTGFAVGWLLIKATDSAQDWLLFDIERGMVAGNDPALTPNETLGESNTFDFVDSSPAGFTIKSALDRINGSGINYVFMAIADPKTFGV